LFLFPRLLRPLLAHPCWGLNFDRQLNLSLNFGRPTLDIREPFATRSTSARVRRIAGNRNVTVRGQWWLWLRSCHWRLSRDGGLLATGSSSSRRIDGALRDLSGQKMTGMDVNPQTGATHFTFDLGCELHCRRLEANSDDDLWALYFPNEKVLVVHGDGSYSYESESSPSPVRHAISH